MVFGFIGVLEIFDVCVVSEFTIVATAVVAVIASIVTIFAYFAAAVTVTVTVAVATVRVAVAGVAVAAAAVTVDVAVVVAVSYFAVTTVSLFAVTVTATATAVPIVVSGEEDLVDDLNHSVARNDVGTDIIVIGVAATAVVALVGHFGELKLVSEFISLEDEARLSDHGLGAGHAVAGAELNLPAGGDAPGPGALSESWSDGRL